MLTGVLSLLLVGCSFSLVAALKCRSCIDITNHDKTMTDIGNPSWAIEDENCRKSHPSATQPDKQCKNPEEVCAAVFFVDNSQNTILLQTCFLLPDQEIAVHTDVYITGFEHETSVRNKFPGFFDKRAGLTVKMRTCNTDVCFPTSGIQIKAYANKTDWSSQILQSLYDKIDQLSSAAYRNASNKNFNETNSTVSHTTLHTISSQTTSIFVPTLQPTLQPMTTEDFENVSSKTFHDFTEISSTTESTGLRSTSNIPGTPSHSFTTTLNSSTKTDSYITTSAVTQSEIPISQARSLAGANSNNPELTAFSKPDLSLLIWVSVPVVGLFVIGTISALALMQRYKTKAKNAIEKEFTRFLDGRVRRNTIFFKNNKDGFDGTYNREVFEIPVSSLEIDESKILDYDDYEKICYGKVVKSGNAIEVAAKMPKVPATPETTMIAVRKLVQEIKVLSYVGTHENVIRFIGAYTENLRNGCVCVFVELCNLGVLQNHLVNLRVKMPSGALDATIAQKLQKWAQEISSGMEYLVSRHVVHADLCTRNIVLDYQETAKIAGFGMSRVIQTNGNLMKQNVEPINWQWMAPESLRSQQFTEKTDVWAFGVILWELYTLGEEPFPGLAWPSNFATQLERGLRLDIPINIPEGIEVLILKSWGFLPENRPTFAEISQILITSG